MTDLIPISPTTQQGTSASLATRSAALSTEVVPQQNQRKFHVSTVAMLATGISFPDPKVSDDHIRDIIKHIMGQEHPNAAPAAAGFLKRTIPWTRELKVLPKGLLETQGQCDARFNRIVDKLVQDHGEYVPVGTWKDSPGLTLPAPGPDERTQMARLADRARSLADRMLPRG